MNDLLTKQDKTFVKEIVETGNKTQSAKKAYKYKNNNTAGVMALEKLRIPKIQNAIKSIADQLPDDKLVEVHLEGLEAGKHIYKNNNETGEIDDLGVEADYAVRHKYLDSAYKLKGSYVTEKPPSPNIHISINVKDKGIVELRNKYEEELRIKLTNEHTE